ncbi:MAG: PBP1A family penicillin-binding protein [Terriglobia bacterium]
MAKASRPNRHPRTARTGNSSGAAARFIHRNYKVLITAACALIVICAVVFLHYYVRFSRLVDQRLSGQIFHRASLVLSAPIPVSPGAPLSMGEVEDLLRKALYSEGEPKGSGVGTFRVSGNSLLVVPGPESFFQAGQDHEGSAAITFNDGKIAAIKDPAGNAPLDHYDLEPEVITTLFDQSRSKRLIVGFHDCPTDLLDAVLSAEDRRFFSHHGVNLFRLIEATLTDIRSDERLQGGSTLTMQLARNFFLVRKKTVKRKADEIFLAILLEHRLSKEEIFTLYANQVYMGQRGSFSIYGFGEAADAYFNKSVKDLTLPQAALIAGMIRGPNLYSPYRYPKRVIARRNWVLGEMARNHYITAEQEANAAAAPLGVAQRNVGGSQAPYFVDMVKDQLLDHIAQQDLLSQSYRIYTTLNPSLQATAANAVLEGMQEVDKRIDSRRKKGSLPGPQPQAALVVLDPHSGDVAALVGGRNYSLSQLNHALAMRQPGSSFKPFVYAAALSSGVDGSQPLITADTVLPDEPETFQFGNITYQPKNYKEEYYGNVTPREALALSLNVATVNLAQMTGYEKIKDLALAAGINGGIQATPAIALGSYDATPLQMAGAYTVFANGGVYEGPRIILAVKDSSGKVVWQSPEVTRRVLDPRISYLMTNLMETVIDHGTGEGARARGFVAPAAGKTGTSHDGWFAGYTSNLLAVAWVGYDNDQDLNLTGASAALPIWTDFMKLAVNLPGYQDVQPFAPPFGIIVAPLDSKAVIATANDPLATPDEVFVDGTQPVSNSVTSTLSNLIRKILPFGSARKGPVSSSATPGVVPTLSSPAVTTLPPPRNLPPAAASANAGEPQKPQGVIKKIFSIFKHHKNKPDQPGPNPGKQ